MGPRITSKRAARLGEPSAAETGVGTPSAAGASSSPSRCAGNDSGVPGASSGVWALSLRLTCRPAFGSFWRCGRANALVEALLGNYRAAPRAVVALPHCRGWFGAAMERAYIGEQINIQPPTVPRLPPEVNRRNPRGLQARPRPQLPCCDNNVIRPISSCANALSRSPIPRRRALDPFVRNPIDRQRRPRRRPSNFGGLDVVGFTAAPPRSRNGEAATSSTSSTCSRRTTELSRWSGDDYINEGVLRAIDVAFEITGADKQTHAPAASAAPARNQRCTTNTRKTVWFAT